MTVIAQDDHLTAGAWAACTSINNNHRIVLFVCLVTLSLFNIFQYPLWFLSDVCLLLFSNLCISICCKVTFIFCSIKLFYFVVQFRIDLYDPLLLSLRLLRFCGFSVSCIPLTLKRYCSPFIGFRTFIKFASCHTRPPFLSIIGSYSAKNNHLFKKKNRINL